MSHHPLDGEECGGEEQAYSEQGDEMHWREGARRVEKRREDEPHERVGQAACPSVRA